MKKLPIIIDTDPGIDDAVALAIALYSEKCDVRLITTVAGNVSLDKVTYNALRLLKFFEKEVPVAKGAEYPLLAPFIDASDIHGKTGLEGFDFDEPDYSLLLKDHAVNAIYKELCKSDEKITIVAIGPLTNIGLLLRMYPDCKEKIEQIILMGGSVTRGNKTVYGEFNIATDPHAAAIVFGSGIKIAVAPLDVGFKVLIFTEDNLKFKSMNKTGGMIYSMLQKYRSGGLKTGLKMYDSFAIAYLLRPDLFKVENAYVEVETESKLCYGATAVDLDGYLGKKPNASVCVDVDGDKFKDWLFESLEKCI